MLPLASVTVQVTVVAPNGKVTGESLATKVTEQLSEVTGVPNANPVTPQVALDETVRAAGATMVGFEASVIVTNCVAVAVLPLASVTVQVTVVAPIGNVVGALFVTLATEQLSEVAGVPKETFNAKQPLLVVVVTANGAVIVGIVVSLTVTVCVLIVTFPDPSVAVQVTVVTPIGYVAGALLINVTVVQLSVATGAVNETVAVHPNPAVAVIATGVVKFGAVLSTTVTN